MGIPAAFMCVDLGVALPTDRLAPLPGMDQQSYPAPLDLRLRKGECCLLSAGQDKRPSEQSEARDCGRREWDSLGFGAALPGEIRPEAFGRREGPLAPAPDASVIMGAESAQTVAPWRGAGEDGARKGLPAAPPPEHPALPAPEQAGTRGSPAAGEEGKWKAEKVRISLPPRKRPYTAAEEDKPAIPSKVALLEENSVLRGQQLGPVRLKAEPEESLLYCRGQEHLLSGPLAAVNGYSYLEPVYMPIGLHQIPYYAGVNKPYLSTPFPLCPVPTHPIPIGTLPAFHPPPCPVLCPREDILASDIAMATRQDEDGDTPLHIAVVQEDVAMVQKLIQFLLLGKKDLDIYNNLRQVGAPRQARVARDRRGERQTHTSRTDTERD